VGWLDSLKEMRQSPEYRNISERNHGLFARIETATDVAEAEQLLETTPSAKIPN